jgi:uncharacterized protein YgbK (DUF1537 family)
MALTIIADDLTGACDTGSLFAGRGRVAVLIDQGERPLDPGAGSAQASDPGPAVLAVDTESRSAPPAEAAGRLRRIATAFESRLSSGRIFKKIDSTFRGPIAAELDVLLSTTALRTALVCPSLPAQQRTVLHGILQVHGAPAHATAVGRDPDYPAATSDLVEILTGHGTRRVSHLPLKEVRGNHHDLLLAVARAPGEIIVADAETPADLQAIARAAIASPFLLLAGSAGLASALSAELGYSGSPAALPPPGAWLIVAGSLHPATRAQVQALAGAGITGAWLEEPATDAAARLTAALAGGRPAYLATHGSTSAPTAAERAATAARLGRMVAGIVEGVQPDLVAITGGDTACAVARELRAERLELLGAPSIGLALGGVVVNGMSRLRVLTKAGGFGAPDLFVTLLGGKRP